MNNYIGHQSQLYGVEEHRLVGGKQDGMILLEIRNGLGLELVLSMSRCADISRLFFKGNSLGYFSPCGYVHPAYYDKEGINWLKSFTAGFLTTCGLNAVGSPCEDNGEVLPLHGTIANTPASSYSYEVLEDKIVVKALILDEVIFSHKLALEREYTISLKENKFFVKDRIVNRGDFEYPAMILYHMNMGYPLLSEKSVLDIPSTSIKGRTPISQKDINEWNKLLPPTPNYEERCYFHTFGKDNRYAKIYSPLINTELSITFSENLDYFTEWKMMGCRDYVLGLEPGNCHPDGRDKMRKEGKLTILKPDESVQYNVCVEVKEK